MTSTTTLAKSEPTLLDGHPGQYSFEHAAHAILTQRAPATLSVPNLSSALVSRVVGGFNQFLDTRSPDERLHWSLDLDRSPEPREPDDGYIRKDKTDRKDFFHFRPDLEFQLQKNRSVRLSAEECSWFGSCQDLLSTCSKAMLRLAQIMDEERPGYDFAKRTSALSHLHVIRILRYDAGYKSLARRHTDRCALTLHVAESEPGLEVIRGFTNIPCVSPKAPNVLVFPGQTMEKITTGAVPALWHGAVDQSQNTQRRWVVVFFGKMQKDAKMF